MEIRNVTDGELELFRETLMNTFGEDAEVDPDGAARFGKLVERSQTWAAFDGAALVATAATLNHHVIVPGGATLAMAGLTTVAVRPTHRRRGILRELVRLHFEDARKRGQPISGLWASEASIYSRFGYGLATEANRMQIERADVLAIAARELDEVEWIDAAAARELFPPIYARVTADRPGALIRSDLWWRERRFMESPFARAGASKLRHIIAKRGGERVGYVQFRQRSGFDQGLASGKVEIVELLALDARAAATLWKLALSFDLFPTVKWWNAPVDDPLAYMASDPRRVTRLRTDGLWLCIDDIPRALEARTYDVDGVVRLRVDGATYELAVEHGRARCVATERPADLELTRPALGAIYLGGTRATQLARADHIHGTDARALAHTDRMFASALAPWCPEVF